MTNIEASIICHPPIPLAHITPLETLVLTNALECREIEASLVPFTDFGAMHPIRVRLHELIEAFRASAPHVDSALNIFIASRIIALLPARSGNADTAASVDIDLSEFPWPFVVQGHRGVIIEPPRSGGEATPIFDFHDELFFEGFTMVRLNKTDSCQCHRCSYRLALSTPPAAPCSRIKAVAASRPRPPSRSKVRSPVSRLSYW
ncbi:hypothetical protein [Sinorhizobium meliloti]|uniref:hypothetical protein n=1 Tax=Rhizobium meliloti TaxID=382 RepID=UPI001F3B44CE|nr:hypothetical protein [Sinorhizobium meliloti]